MIRTTTNKQTQNKLYQTTPIQYTHCYCRFVSSNVNMNEREGKNMTSKLCVYDQNKR